MKKKYAEIEDRVRKWFEERKTFTYRDQCYNVTLVGKPRPTGGGECKTDVYIHCLEGVFCVSVKMKNISGFAESKLSKERARDVFGEQYEKILHKHAESLREAFENTPLLYTKDAYPTQKGSITLGWRLEVLTKPRRLAGKLRMPKKEIIEAFYKGTNMRSDKRDCYVGNVFVPDSGVATHIVEIDDTCDTFDELLEKMIPLDEFEAPTLYLGYVANNYRTIEKKCDGSRPLAVLIEWAIENEKLVRKIVTDKPLHTTGKNMRKYVDFVFHEMHSLNVHPLAEPHIQY